MSGKPPVHFWQQVAIKAPTKQLTNTCKHWKVCYMICFIHIPVQKQFIIVSQGCFWNVSTIFRAIFGAQNMQRLPLGRVAAAGDANVADPGAMDGHLGSAAAVEPGAGRVCRVCRVCGLRRGWRAVERDRNNM